MKLKDGYLYRIEARNSEFGIYDDKEKGFHIARYDSWTGDCYKFIENTVGYEYEIHQTAMAIEEIEKAPDFKDEKEFLKYMKEIEE